MPSSTMPSRAYVRRRPAIPGIAGVPFLIFYGEVSDDSDGPIELCRPVANDTGAAAVAAMPDMQLRIEHAHEEAYIPLTYKEMSWPEMLPAYDALGHWVSETCAGARRSGPPAPDCRSAHRHTGHADLRSLCSAAMTGRTGCDVRPVADASD